MDPLVTLRDRAHLRLGRCVGAVVGVPLALVLGGDVWKRTGHIGEPLAAGSEAALVLAAAIVVGGLAARATGRRRAGGGVVHGMGAALVLLVLFAVLATATEVPNVINGQKRARDLPLAFLAVMFFGLIPALVGGSLAGLVLQARLKVDGVDRGA